MAETSNIGIAAVLTDRATIDEALAKAVRETLLTHARLGRSVPQQMNGKVVWITPEEIFAQYGLDENGKPKV